MEKALDALTNCDDVVGIEDGAEHMKLNYYVDVLSDALEQPRSIFEAGKYLKNFAAMIQNSDNRKSSVLTYHMIPISSLNFENTLTKSPAIYCDINPRVLSDIFQSFDYFDSWERKVLTIKNELDESTENIPLEIYAIITEKLALIQDARLNLSVKLQEPIKNVRNGVSDSEELSNILAENTNAELDAVEMAKFFQKFDEYIERIENLCKKLNTDSENGIPYTAVDLKERKDKYGTNEIPLPPMKSFLFLVSEAMQDLTLIILIVSAIISLTLSFLLPKEDENVNDHNKHEVKSWIEGAAILIFVAVVVLVTALIDYTKERQFRDFQSKKKTDNKKIAVIRQGFEIEIPVDELVVGDIAQIKCGDVLPVDGIIIQSTDLRIDESSLTGESYWIRKSAEYDPMLLSGTNVMEGNGRMLVTTVGVHSQNGIIMTLLGAAADNKGFMVKQG
uniref:Cation-transporting P-type ATPase N-terminal domain-containing protein n=1 Tax=Panagrolaimus sp. PS1159 TaxID=55785 RepID=A0AC35FFN9_9BILA